MRSYDECIRERFAAYGEPVPAESAIGESSIVRRFLQAAGKSEVESATKTVRELKTAPEDQAVMQVIEERRGDASDILVSVLAAGASGLLGAGVGQYVNRYVAAVPGAAMVVAGLLAKQPFAVRSGLVNSGLSWIAGANSTK